MDKETIDRLKKELAWLKYALDLFFLNSFHNVRFVIQNPVISDITARLKDEVRRIRPVNASYFRSDRYKNQYWGLLFLADLGLESHTFYMGLGPQNQPSLLMSFLLSRIEKRLKDNQ